jgi:predicted alpha/beta hydrolase
LSSIVTVSSSSGYFRNIALKQRLFATVFLKAYIPLLAKVLGYVPARWIGFGEDLPAGVALQWAAWCTSPGYVENSFGNEVTEHFYDEIDVPTLWLTATDDPIVTPKNVDDMLRLLKSAPVTRRRIDPADFDLRRIGHADFFRKRNATLWPLVTDWLSQRPA